MESSKKYFIEDYEIINGINVGDIVDKNDNVIIDKGYLEDNKLDVNLVLEILEKRDEFNK
mgnify:FL=1